jgi:HSP20 family molecular chaperone IbpA
MAEELTKVVKYTSLFDQMDKTFSALARRAYEIFERNGRVFGRDLENWFQAERELLHPVALNITETDEAFTVKAEVPGFTEKEIEVGVEQGRVTICGHANPRRRKRRERRFVPRVARAKS